MSTQSALLKVMSDAARKAARGLNRDFGELAELQVAKKAPADFVTAADLKAVTIVAESPMVFLVPPNSPHRTLAEFVAFAREVCGVK